MFLDYIFKYILNTSDKDSLNTDNFTLTVRNFLGKIVLPICKKKLHVVF